MPANNKMVPLAGLEPALCCQKRILNPSRLPVPPQRHTIRAALLPQSAVNVNPQLRLLDGMKKAWQEAR